MRGACVVNEWRGIGDKGELKSSGGDTGALQEPWWCCKVHELTSSEEPLLNCSHRSHCSHSKYRRYRRVEEQTSIGVEEAFEAKET